MCRNDLCADTSRSALTVGIDGKVRLHRCALGIAALKPVTALYFMGELMSLIHHFKNAEHVNNRRDQISTRTVKSQPQLYAYNDLSTIVALYKYFHER